MFVVLCFSGDIAAENVRSRCLQREMDTMINDLQNVLWLTRFVFVPLQRLVHVQCIFPSLDISRNEPFSFDFIDELLAEKEKYKNVSEELDMTLNELSGY